MILDKPYFMTNNEWYYFDYESGKYKLTSAAPQEAVDSYNKFYMEISKVYGSD